MKDEYQIYLKQNKEQLSEILINCCYGSYDFELASFLLTSPLISQEQRPDVNESQAFHYACHCGYTDIAILILTHPDISPKPDIHYGDDLAFMNICEYGFNELFDFFLFSEKMIERPNIHTNDDYPFRFAASAGRSYIVKTLLTSSELTSHPDIHANDDQAFRDTCQYYSLEMVEFLAQSPLLTEHANIVAGIIPACKNKEENVFSILNYLYQFDEVQHFLRHNTDKCISSIFEHSYESVPLNNFKWLMDKPEIFYNLSHSIEDSSFFTILAKTTRDDIKQSLFMEYGYRLNDEQLQWLHEKRKNKSIKQTLNIYKKIQLHDNFLDTNANQELEQFGKSLKI